MLSTETSHYPSADDITLDSLEYLFGESQVPAPADTHPIPWVVIESGDHKNAEKDRRLSLMEQQLEHNQRQVQKLSAFIGYMQGLLQEKDEQLKLLPELRYKAGLAVARGLEAERAKERIRELEDTIQRLRQSSHWHPEEIVNVTVDWINRDETAISILNWLGLIGLSGVLYTVVMGF